MPLPERPNVTEFTPLESFEPTEPRKAFRLLVIPVSVLLLLSTMMILLGLRGLGAYALVEVLQVGDRQEGPPGDPYHAGYVASMVKVYGMLLFGGIAGMLGALLWLRSRWRKTDVFSFSAVLLLSFAYPVAKLVGGLVRNMVANSQPPLPLVRPSGQAFLSNRSQPPGQAKSWSGMFNKCLNSVKNHNAHTRSAQSVRPASRASALVSLLAGTRLFSRRSGQRQSALCHRYSATKRDRRAAFGSRAQ